MHSVHKIKMQEDAYLIVKEDMKKATHILVLYSLVLHNSKYMEWAGRKKSQSKLMKDFFLISYNLNSQMKCNRGLY